MSAKNKIIRRKIGTRGFLAVAATIIALALTTAGLLTFSQTIPSMGTITTVNVGVYSDSECTQNLTSINWGQIRPGNSVSKTIYVKNTGNTPMTLSMLTNSWNPSTASSYITITWDKTDATVQVGDSTAAVLTLTVASDITGIESFSANIVITGTG